MTIVANVARHATPSTFACVGACGYLVGVALPLFPGLDLPLIFLVLLATFAAVTGLNQRRVSRSVALIAALGFVGARMASSLAALHPFRSLQLLAPLLPALLLFFLLSEWIETRQQVTAIFMSLTVAGFVLGATVVAIAWLSDPSNAGAWVRTALSPMLVVKNDVTMMAVISPLALAAAWLRPRRLVLGVVIAFFASLITVIAVVQSRTAFVTVLVAVTAFVLLARGRRLPHRLRLLALLVGLVVVVVGVEALLGFRLAHKVVHEWQGSGRLALWAAALAMFRDAPLLGHGPASYVLHYRAHIDALQLPAWIQVDPRLTPWAHNLYLELLAEQGIVGLAAFVAMAASGFWMMNRIRSSRDHGLQSLGAGAGAALVAFLTAACFELSFLRAWVTIVFFTLLGILTTLIRSAARAEHEQHAVDASGRRDTHSVGRVRRAGRRLARLAH